MWIYRLVLWLVFAGSGTAMLSAQQPAPPQPPAKPSIASQAEVAARRAAELERRAATALALEDSSSVGRASELLAAAAREWQMAGQDSASIATFERAGALAQRAGRTESAYLLYGTALQERDPSARGQIHDLLDASPLLLRDAEAEASFVGRARALLVALGILDVATARKAIRSAVDAYAKLEELAAGSNQVLVRLRSSPGPGLEVRIRRWISQYKNAPWTTVRTDTALVRSPMHYEFCYIDATSKKAMLVDQPCADGCTLVLPSDHAIRAKGADASCGGT